jgi:multidrug transporter EmrE-like cation transporter
VAGFFLFGQTLNTVALFGVAMILVAGTIIALRAR